MDYCNPASPLLLAWLLSLLLVLSGLEQVGRWLSTCNVSCWPCFFWELMVWFQSLHSGCGADVEFLSLNICLQVFPTMEFRMVKSENIWNFHIKCQFSSKPISLCFCLATLRLILYVCVYFTYFNVFTLTDWCTDFVCENERLLYPNSFSLFFFYAQLAAWTICLCSSVCTVFISIHAQEVWRNLSNTMLEMI